MNEESRSSQLGYSLAMLVSLLAITTAAIWVRAAGDTSAALLACGRNLLAGTLLLPWLLRAPPSRVEVRWALLAGLALGAHFVLWFASLGMTTVAAATTLVCTTPLWLAFAERLSGRVVGKAKWAAIGLGVIGTAVIATGDARGEAGLLGCVLALAGAWMAAAYYWISRRARATAQLLPFVSLVNLIAGAAVLPLVLFLGARGELLIAPNAWIFIVGLALVPQLIGHNLQIWALKKRGSASVSLFVLGEPILAALLAFAIWGEAPTAWTIAGAALILPSLALAISARPER